jgi:transposase
MTRLRGRAPRGQRLHSAAPCGHWCTTTMISSIRLDGTTACMTIDGATDTEVFRAYVGGVLLPTLKPGDLVVMDNLRAHKNDETIGLITGAGARVLFLPPYSPDLNPIEMMWSKVKNLLRGAEARTPDELFAAVGNALSRVTAKDAAHWFAHCGYSFI